ncbi:hypothetical protein SCOCK_280087 [Actinacidiphila cocklensis]|uniref:Uncharacterized protein n=1 Tax=Actinacidiphila cocklensis TaxID=887465 RepID=A0A9W4DRG2_9ACTN|nr:hypothetical protein SCOCK_280087 [Actinacidiphila cocklensis]
MFPVICVSAVTGHESSFPAESDDQVRGLQMQAPRPLGKDDPLSRPSCAEAACKGVAPEARGAAGALWGARCVRTARSSEPFKRPSWCWWYLMEPVGSWGNFAAWHAVNQLCGFSPERLCANSCVPTLPGLGFRLVKTIQAPGAGIGDRASHRNAVEGDLRGPIPPRLLRTDRLGRRRAGPAGRGPRRRARGRGPRRHRTGPPRGRPRGRRRAHRRLRPLLAAHRRAAGADLVGRVPPLPAPQPLAVA